MKQYPNLYIPPRCELWAVPDSRMANRTNAPSTISFSAVSVSQSPWRRQQVFRGPGERRKNRASRSRDLLKYLTCKSVGVSWTPSRGKGFYPNVCTVYPSMKTLDHRSLQSSSPLISQWPHSQRPHSPDFQQYHSHVRAHTEERRGLSPVGSMDSRRG